MNKDGGALNDNSFVNGKISKLVNDNIDNLFETPAPEEADKDWNECMDILRRGQYKSASETCHALLAWRDKAVIDELAYALHATAHMSRKDAHQFILDRLNQLNGAKDDS